jgi:hypothetical protein
VLAVEVHEAFLGEDPPDPEVVAAAVDRVRR